jgi:hypothetical protein
MDKVGNRYRHDVIVYGNYCFIWHLLRVGYGNYLISYIKQHHLLRNFFIRLKPVCNSVKGIAFLMIFLVSTTVHFQLKDFTERKKPGSREQGCGTIMIYCCYGSEFGKVSVFGSGSGSGFGSGTKIQLRIPEPDPIRNRFRKSKKLRFLRFRVHNTARENRMKQNKKYLPPPITGWHIPAEFDCKYETSDPRAEKPKLCSLLASH